MENKFLEKYENQAIIKISKEDEIKFMKDGNLSFKSAEEVQGFLYKYGKEFLLQIELEDGSYRLIDSIFNSKEINKYIDKNNEITYYAVNLTLNTAKSIKESTFKNDLSKIDIEFLLTELEPNQRKQLLFLINENNNLPKRKIR